MAETDLEQGTGANGAQEQGEQIAQEPGAHAQEPGEQQPWTEAPAAPAAPVGPIAGRRRGKMIACVALVGGGAFAAIRKGRRARAHRQSQRRWPVVPAMLTRAGRSRRAASSARGRKRRCR
jgi:hypothetical protein